jgi:CheY-like chemotaxis protein
MAGPIRDEGVILLVDDEPDALRFVADALESAGYTALIATSGRAAIDLLSHATPDLILMDAIMPGLDGFETVARIKDAAPLAPIPVIFMTGLIGSEHVVKGFRVGGADYVRKPVNVDELLARVGAHIGNGRAIQAGLAGLEASGRLMFATDRSGRLRWCTPAAKAALAALQPGWGDDADQLPAAMMRAVTRLIDIRHLPGASVKLEQPSDIEIALVSHYRNDELLIRLTQANPEAETLRLRDNLSLTRREAEVLPTIRS